MTVQTFMMQDINGNIEGRYVSYSDYIAIRDELSSADGVGRMLLRENNDLRSKLSSITKDMPDPEYLLGVAKWDQHFIDHNAMSHRDYDERKKMNDWLIRCASLDEKGGG